MNRLLIHSSHLIFQIILWNCVNIINIFVTSLPLKTFHYTSHCRSFFNYSLWSIWAISLYSQMIFLINFWSEYFGRPTLSFTLCSGIFEINCSKDVKVQGIIGPCASLEKVWSLSLMIGHFNLPLVHLNSFWFNAERSIMLWNCHWPRKYHCMEVVWPWQNYFLVYNIWRCQEREPRYYCSIS